MKKLPLIATFFSLTSVTVAQNLTIVNAASLSSVSVAPKSIVSIKGTNLSSNVAVAPDPSSPPTSLGGVSVSIGGTAAALFYVSPRQINAVVAASTPLGPQQVVVTGGSTKQTGTVTISTAAPPGLFSLSGSGMRDGAIVDAVNFHFGEFSLQTTNGQTYLALFGTGISVSSPPTVTIGGLPAQVVFYGTAPCCAGLEQVNVLPPSSAAGAGRVPVVLTSNGQTSNSVDVVVLPAKGQGPFPHYADNQTRSRALSTLAYIPGTSLLLSADQNDDVVRVLDASGQKVIQTITLPEGSGPTGMAVNSAGTLAVITESDLGKVAVLDLAKYTVAAEITVGASPVAVAISGTQAVVANQESDTVSVIDLTTGAVQKSIAVGHGPAAVAADAGAKQAYVVNEADGTMSVIDLTSLTLNKTISLGEATRSENIAIIPGAGIAFVTVPTAGPAGLVLAVNVSTGKVVSFEANPDRSGGETGVAYLNAKLYLANQTGASVSIVPVNSTTGAPIGAAVTVKTDLGASALAIDIKDNLLAVSNQGSGTIVLINLATDQVTAHINAVKSAEDDEDDHGDRGKAPNLPSISNITPASGKAGTSFTMTIAGKNLSGATGILFLLHGSDSQHEKSRGDQTDSAIAVSNLKVSSDGTQLTATITLGSSAQPRQRTVRVVTPNGESISAPAMGMFMVTP